MDYSNYAVNDFVWDEDFRKWVLHPTKERDQYWTNLLERFPELREEVSAAREIVLAMNLNDHPVSSQEMNSWIDETMHEVTRPAIRRVAPKNLFVAAAAVASVVLVAAYFLFRNDVGETVKSAPLQAFVFENKSDIAKNIRLADGTQVILDPDASVTVDSNFNQSERSVILKGNAFFNVVADTAKPFVVHSGKLETRVLGTAFTVETDTAQKILHVVVRRGLVSVAADDATVERKILLKPNQQADYGIASGTLVKTIARAPLLLDSLIDFNYNATPVYQIFSDIRAAYGIPVSYSKTSVPNHAFSGNLLGKGFRDKIKIICAALELDYKIEDGEIRIY
ncbi:FecR family protein [Niabella insulamsoli]|uniref:FecR family protein n=1 Tax=Niabella insulamsoli TaxID=3144874 RepID=UPI0031FBB0EB